jgi:hypothetical protein
MATATRQSPGADGVGVTSLVVNLSATLAGSILSVCTFYGGNDTPTINAPTDSGTQTYTARLAQANVGTGTNAGLRIDDVLNSASGITTVTAHLGSADEITCVVLELAGTGNAVRGSVPAATTGISVTSLATNAITASAGDILAAFITDIGGGNTQYSTSPAAYAVDTYTPNGTNERGGGAHADNVSAGSLACTFGNIPTATAICAQVCYQAAAGAFDPSTVSWPAQQPLTPGYAVVGF